MTWLLKATYYNDTAVYESDTAQWEPTSADDELSKDLAQHLNSVVEDYVIGPADGFPTIAIANRLREQFPHMQIEENSAELNKIRRAGPPSRIF